MHNEAAMARLDEMYKQLAQEAQSCEMSDAELKEVLPEGWEVLEGKCEEPPF